MKMTIVRAAAAAVLAAAVGGAHAQTSAIQEIEKYRAALGDGNPADSSTHRICRRRSSFSGRFCNILREAAAVNGSSYTATLPVILFTKLDLYSRMGVHQTRYGGASN